MGVGRGCLGLVWMGGRGSGVETLGGRELYQGGGWSRLVRRWAFLRWLLWVIPFGGHFFYSGHIRCRCLLFGFGY